MKEIIKFWLDEQNKAKQFTGWDFSYLKDRWKEQDLPWDYLKIVKEILKPHDYLLDMDTGGGELLLTLNHQFNLTTVTETYQPNVEECKKRLVPLGINLAQCDGDANVYPFKDNYYDVIINRHGSYNLQEIYRILKPHGYFITQQVGAWNNKGLRERLSKNFKLLYPFHYLDKQLSEVKKHPFEIITAKEAFPKLHFFDIGALVYFATIISWEFQNFDVMKKQKQLLELHQMCLHDGEVTSLEHRFIFVIKKEKKLL